MRLGGVFHNPKIVFSGNRKNLIHVCHLAVQVYGDNTFNFFSSFRAEGSESFGKFGRRKIIGEWIYIHEPDGASCLGNSLRRTNKCIRNGNYFITGLKSQRNKNQAKCVGATSYRCAMIRSASNGKLAFK